MLRGDSSCPQLLLSCRYTSHLPPMLYRSTVLKPLLSTDCSCYTKSHTWMHFLIPQSGLCCFAFACFCAYACTFQRSANSVPSHVICCDSSCLRMLLSFHYIPSVTNYCTVYICGADSHKWIHLLIPSDANTNLSLKGVLQNIWS